ncbi:hypothetical protein ACS0TY_018975 [Phlomoides rotata]
MGEDLFWAIRGGGGGSFGIIVSFKVQLVDVPEKVTVFNIHRTLQQNTDKYLSWSSRLYNYLTPYVENSPRASYFNYRDLDLGVNNPKEKTSYAQASIWGKKYFKNNFDRLVRVKTDVDPKNFFRNEQSFPPLDSRFTYVDED